MKKRIASLMDGFELNEAASLSLIDDVETRLRVTLPVDYREFMTESNGGEGRVGAHSYLVLWRFEDIIPLNEAYAIREFAPGLILFGSDGGDTAYAFDAREGVWAIVEVPFIGMSVDETKLLGTTFLDFLQYLSAQ